MNTRSIVSTILSLALFASFATSAVAQTTGGDGTEINPQNTYTPPKATLNLQCVQVAVDVREAAIGVAFLNFTTAQTAALAARKSALHDAWGIQDDTLRRSTRNAAWVKYRTDAAAAWSTMRAARSLAWSNFRTTSRGECKVPVVESYTGSLSL